MNRRSSKTETINQLNADIGCAIVIQSELVASVKKSPLFRRMYEPSLQIYMKSTHLGLVTTSRFYFLDKGSYAINLRLTKISGSLKGTHAY